MPDFPSNTPALQPSVTGTCHPHCLGVDLTSISSLTSGTGAWPTANLAILVPMVLQYPITARQMFVVNGGTVSGNIDVGIYSSTFQRLVSIGTTAQSGTTALQSFNITDTYLPSGLYYLATAMDNNTGIVQNHQPSIASLRMMGVLAATGSFVLPASITVSALAAAYVPDIQVTEQTVI